MVVYSIIFIAFIKRVAQHTLQFTQDFINLHVVKIRGFPRNFILLGILPSASVLASIETIIVSDLLASITT